MTDQSNFYPGKCLIHLRAKVSTSPKLPAYRRPPQNTSGLGFIGDQIPPALILPLIHYENFLPSSGPIISYERTGPEQHTSTLKQQGLSNWPKLFSVKIINVFIFGGAGSPLMCSGFLQLRRVGAALLLCSLGPRVQAQQLWNIGLVALWHMESSRTGNQTHVPCTGSWIHQKKQWRHLVTGMRCQNVFLRHRLTLPRGTRLLSPLPRPGSLHSRTIMHILPSFCIVFNFLHQCLTAFRVQVFHFLGSVYSQAFYSFQGNCK